MRKYLIVCGETIYLKFFNNYDAAEKWASTKSNFSNDSIIKEYKELIEYKTFSINLN
jgi:hypothetical protein